jgi:hypothetical protein
VIRGLGGGPKARLKLGSHHLADAFA